MKTNLQPSDIDKHVGSRLRIRRIYCGLSMERLAELVGLTYQQIQKYETGKNRISCGRLWQLASILDVSVLYFFPGYETKNTLDSGTISLKVGEK